MTNKVLLVCTWIISIPTRTEFLIWVKEFTVLFIYKKYCLFAIVLEMLFIFTVFVIFSLVFRMVEAEEEYMEQMEVLVSCFLRPFKMAASSKKPPCSHEDVNSIFLNSETVLFLHQIFLKGLTSRMESWPTLVLGR